MNQLGGSVSRSAGGDLDIHLVEAALRIDRRQTRGRQSCGTADRLIDRDQGNLSVLIENHLTLRVDHHNLRDLPPPVRGGISGTGWLASLQRVDRQGQQIDPPAS